MPKKTSFSEFKDKLSGYQQVLNGLGLPILIIDGKGHIITMNSSAHLFYQFGEDDLVDDISSFILEPPLVELLTKNLGEDGRLGSWSREFLIKLGDQTQTRATITVSTILDLNKCLYCLITIPPDILKFPRISEINHILAQIDALFGDGLDYKEKMPALARLLIPEIADQCSIYLVEEDSSIGLAAFAPDDAITNQAVYDWINNDLPNDEADGIPLVIREGKPKLVTQVNPVRRGAEAGIKSYMIVPLISGKEILGAVTLILANSDRHFETRMLDLAENLALHITTYLEKSQLHRERQHLSAELQKHQGDRASELREAKAQLGQTEEIVQTLFRVSNKLNATLDVELILDMLAQEAIQIVNGESGFAGLRTPEGMTVHKYFQDGAAIPFEHTWALGEGVPGWVLKYKVPYGTSDAQNDPLIRHELSINANIHSVICTPILDSIGEVIAYFDIRNKQGEEVFTINDQEMLLTMAPVASIAIQNALAYQQRMATVTELEESSKQLEELAASLETAREEERTKISRELHDELGQALTAVKFDLATLANQLEGKDETLAQKAKDIISQMNTLIKTVRRIATELRPGMLDDLGFMASLEWLVHDFEKRSGIECKLSLQQEDVNLTSEQSLAIFRIVQEALTNVARYADARHVDIQVEKIGDHLFVELHDDGLGIKQQEISSTHSLGLLGMRERAKYLGGKFEIKGIPNKGTTIKVSIPVDKIEVGQEIGGRDAENITG